MIEKVDNFLECWAYLLEIISDAPVVRKAILLLLLPKFYRCYLYHHMLQFQKLLPHLLSQGSKWQTNNFWKLYYFCQLYVSFLTYFYSVGDWTYTPSYRHSLSNLTTSEVILMIMNNELWQKLGLTHVPPACYQLSYFGVAS